MSSGTPSVFLRDDTKIAHLLRFPFCFLALLCIGLSVGAQSPDVSSPSLSPSTDQGQAPELKTETIAIPVRVVVRDRRGHAVLGLKKEDFQLYQDGKIQQISNFTAISGSVNSAGTEGGESRTNSAVGERPGRDSPEAITAGGPPKAMRGRFVALFFDDMHLQQKDLDFRWCPNLKLLVISIVIFSALCGSWGGRIQGIVRYEEVGRAYGYPMLPFENIPITYFAVSSKPNLPAIIFVQQVVTKNRCLWRLSPRNCNERSNAYRGTVTWRHDWAIKANRKWLFRIIEGWPVTGIENFHSESPFNILGGSFPGVLNGHTDQYCFPGLNLSAKDSVVYPCALVVAHNIELSIQNYELVDAGCREYESKCGDTPIGDAATISHPFAESSPTRWFFIVAGLLCGVFGGFLFIVGVGFFGIHEQSSFGAAACVLLGLMFFALVFVFAHIAFIAGDTVPQKYRLTTINYWGTVMAIGDTAMANVLSVEKQTAIIGALAEGSSIRSIERQTGVHRDTIMRLGVRIGQGCTSVLDSKMRNLPCQNLQFDEIWGFIGKKERHVRPTDDPTMGDVWTFCAIDSDTKLVPSFKCGKRDHVTANAFVADVKSRMRNRVQISCDALREYVGAIEESFGADVDFAQIIKTYVHDDSIHPERQYSPSEIVITEKRRVAGFPNLRKASTSHIERLNGTTRLHMRRLTRLTYAFSKKRENFEAAVALHFAYYNFVKRHNTLRATPAMAAGIERDFWSVSDLVKAAA